MLRRHRFLMLLALFASTCALAVADPPDDDEVWRKTLEVLRKHPDHLDKLRENWKSFAALSEPRKQAILKLDKDFDKVVGKKKERYWNALVRYSEWLENLRKSDPKAHEAIKLAPDAKSRLALIKDRRLREWMESQPKKYRDEWDNLKGEARVEYVIKRREAERARQSQWAIAKRFWSELENKQVMPSRFADFMTKEKGKKGDEVNKVRDYFNDYVLPYLTEQQKKQLADAEGRWPEFPQTLVEIARKRPSALPVKGEKLPTQFGQLPKPIQTKVQTAKAVKKKLLDELRAFEGRPEFVRKVVEVGTKHGAQPFEHEFWALNYKSLHKPMQDFVNDLQRRLDKVEDRTLLDSQNKWPEYPQTIQELARKHNMVPPWHYLPDPERWKWDLYRAPQATSWDLESLKEDKR